MVYTEWRDTWPDVVVDRKTDDAIRLVEHYYALEDDGRPRYTGARFEAIAALNQDPNALGPADFVAVSMLSVDVPAKAALRLLSAETAARVRELLEQIPQSDIVDVESDVLASGGASSQLWQLLRSVRDGLGPTTTSKLIAAKRPRLVPIWDSFVQRTTGLDTDDYWRQFQAVLLADDRKIWLWLDELRQQSAGVPANVSNLRILDVLLWMTAEGS